MIQPLLSSREYLELLGPALHLLRQRLHLRQQEIAERAGFTMAQYSLYECGRQVPSLETLFKLLPALEADLATLEEAIHAVKRLAASERSPAEDGIGEADPRGGRVIRMKLDPDSRPSS